MSMSCDHLSNDIPECPLCLEPFSLDDINFYPCACRYQICRFCWHRIRTDENGLCPHCREPYSENPAEYTPPSQDQLVKLKHDKKQKTHDKKQKLIESRKNLSSLRVVQKNLVFVIGLSPRLAEPEILRKNEYFGKYGKIYKVVINNSTVYNGSQGPSVSAYVTYYREEDASKAIQAVNNAFIDGRHLKASYGTTKYCTYFLRGSQCTKPDCMYLHEMGNEEASFTKEDMQAGKHQVFESQTLAASNTGMILVGREQGCQTLTKKQQQDPLLTTAKEIELESALPASASWGTRQTGGGLLPLPQMKEGKAQSSSTKHKSQKSQKHSSSHTKSSDGSGGKSSGRGSRSSDPLSPHSILGPGPGFDTGTTRRHNSTGSRIEHSSSNTRSTSITRSNSTAASVSSKSVSPDLSPKSSLSTSSSCGSLKQDFEGREGGTAMNSEHEITRDVEVSFGKPHPLESTVSRQLDSIDLDDEDDWGLQEVRANDDVISETSDTVTMATDTTNMIKTRSLTHQTSIHESMREKAESTDRESMRQDPVDVISSLGSTATGQFGSLGVSWNSGAPPLATNSSPPLSPSQYSGPGEQNTAQTSRQMERNQTPDDDLGFDPWDESARGLAALLETEQQPSHSRLTASSTVNGPDRRGGGMIDTLASSTGTFDSTTNLSWQDELKTVFPNVNISFGVPSSSTSVPIQQRLATPTTTSSSTPSQFSSSTVHSVQTPLQQAINGAAQSHSFPYHQVGVGGMGALFGYATPAQLHSMPDYRSLYEASPTNQSLLASVRSAFDAPKLPNTSTTNTPSTDPTQSSSTDSTSISNRDMAPGYTSMNGIQTSKGYVGSSSNTIEWPDLAAASGVTAVGSKRTAKNGSTSGTGNTGTGLLSSNVATWNGSMGNGILAGNGNGGTKDSATGVIGTTNSTARSKETSSSSGAIAPPPGFTTKSSKDNMSLSSSINNALWNNNTLTKGGAGQAAGVGATQQTNPAMTNQILQNWAKYLQMNFGGLTRQQLANNPLYQQMVRQQQQYWAMLRQQQLLQLQQAGVAAAGGVSVPGRNVLTPAQIQQLQTRMALSQSALNQATAHARLQQQHHLQQTLKHSHQQAHQQTRNSLGHIGIPVATVPVSGQSVANLGQTVRLGQPQGGAVGGVLSQSSNKSSQQSQNVPSK